MQITSLNYPTFKQLVSSIFKNIHAMFTWGSTSGVALIGTQHPMCVFFSDANTSISTVQADFPLSANCLVQPSIASSGSRLLITADSSQIITTDFVSIVGSIHNLDDVIWYDAGGGQGVVYAFFGDQKDIIVKTISVPNTTIIPSLWPNAVQFSNNIILNTGP